MLLFSSHYADLFMNVNRYRGICPNSNAAQSHIRQQLPTGSYFTGSLLSNLFMKTSVTRPYRLCSAIRFENIYIRLSWNGPGCTVPDTGCGCGGRGCESSRHRQGRTARGQARDDWGTAHRHWGKITIRIRSLIGGFCTYQWSGVKHVIALPDIQIVADVTDGVWKYSSDTTSSCCMYSLSKRMCYQSDVREICCVAGMWEVLYWFFQKFWILDIVLSVR